MSNRLLLVPAAALIVLAVLLVWFSTKPPEQSSTDSIPVTGQVHGIKLRFGHNTPTDSSLHAAATRFAERVAERSNGEVTIEVFPAQQLGNDHQMVEMARRGELDILLTPTAKMSVPVPAMQYADLPFYFPSREDLYSMLDGEPGRLLLEKLRPIGLVGVTFWENGFKHFSANRPLLGPDDFAGLKIRTMKSRMLMRQFQSLDAQPIPIDFHSTYQALADGVVDGQENPLIAIYSMGFYKVQSDLTLSSHGYLGYVLSISAKSFERLPQQLRTLLIDTARELTVWEREETHRREERLLEEIRNSGVRIHTLTPTARQQFAQRLSHVSEQFEPVIGADLLSLTDELLRNKYSSPDAAKRPLLIGLNADLSMDARISGIAIKRGATLAIEEINANGGVLGRPLRLWARDHKGFPSRALDNLQQFIDNRDVVALLTGLHSPVVIASQKMAQQAHLPLLASWSAASEVTDNNLQPNPVFRISANDRLVAPYLMEYIARHYKHPAMVHENSLWGRSNLQRMSTALQEYGLSFTLTESFNRGMQEFGPALARIVASNADVIVLIANPSEGASLLDAVAASHKPLPVLSHWGVMGGDFWSQNQRTLAQVDLILFQTFSFASTKSSHAQRLYERYRQRFGLERNGEVLAAQGVVQSHDLVLLLARAIELAGRSDRAAIHAALEQLDTIDGALKRYDHPFTSEQHDALDTSNYLLVRYAPDGRLLPIDHPDLQ